MDTCVVVWAGVQSPQRRLEAGLCCTAGMFFSEFARQADEGVILSILLEPNVLMFCCGE